MKHENIKKLFDAARHREPQALFDPGAFGAEYDVKWSDE
jgi:hypothetical protein